MQSSSFSVVLRGAPRFIPLLIGEVLPMQPAAVGQELCHGTRSTCRVFPNRGQNPRWGYCAPSQVRCNHANSNQVGHNPENICSTRLVGAQQRRHRGSGSDGGRFSQSVHSLRGAGMSSVVVWLTSGGILEYVAAPGVDVVAIDFMNLDAGDPLPELTEAQATFIKEQVPSLLEDLAQYS